MSLNDEKLEPMPPPPAPKAHPMSTLPLPHLYQLHNASIKASTNLDEQLTPLSPPVPHTHPLIALNDESAHNDKLQRGRDGMAISSHQTISNRKTTIGQQGNSTSLSRNRIKACTGQHQETLQSGNPLAYEAEHVSRADAIQMLQHVRFMEKAPVLVPLGDQEKVIAATKASDSRCELVQVARQLVMNERRWSNGDGDHGKAMKKEHRGGALARASARKVKKQLDAKWVQSREDPANRPKGPLERPEERSLRETLFRTTPLDLLQSKVLYDETDAARNVTFGPMSQIELPMVSSSIVGLAGCCFDNY